MSKVFLEISQNSQENTCARVSFLIKLHWRFPVNFTKFLKKNVLLIIILIMHLSVNTNYNSPYFFMIFYKYFFLFFSFLFFL